MLKNYIFFYIFHSIRFLKPLSETLSLMEEIFEGIQRDTFEVQTGRRYIRSVGAALSIAVNLLEVYIYFFFFLILVFILYCL